jgi:peptide/nickel transport system permease protein
MSHNNIRIIQKRKENVLNEANLNRIGYHSPLRLALQKVSTNNRARVGAIIVITAIAIAIFSPLIAPYDPIQTNFTDRLIAPNPMHLFGTDNLGRDVFSRTLVGTRVSLGISIITVSLALIVGVPLGIISGFYGSWQDSVIMRLIDFQLAFPATLLAIVIAGTLGPSLRNAMIAVGVMMVPTFTRVVRSSTLSIKESSFIIAARALGANPGYIMLRHILPNIADPLIVLSSLTIGSAILSTAGLSFIGLGAQPPTPEWGAMLSTGRDYIRQQWWISTFPGLAIAILVLGVNLLGDVIRDALDPHTFYT